MHAHTLGTCCFGMEAEHSNLKPSVSANILSVIIDKRGRRRGFQVFLVPLLDVSVLQD